MGRRDRLGTAVSRESSVGKTSEEDLAAQFASGFGKKRCPNCKRPAAGAIRSLAQESELIQRHPNTVAKIIKMRQALDPGAPPQMPSFQSKYGNLVVLNEITPCAWCFPAAERAAAKHPSWILVEIDRPHSRKIMGSVPVKLERGGGQTAGAIATAASTALAASSTKH